MVFMMFGHALLKSVTNRFLKKNDFAVSDHMIQCVQFGAHQLRGSMDMIRWLRRDELSGPEELPLDRTGAMEQILSIESNGVFTDCPAIGMVSLC